MIFRNNKEVLGTSGVKATLNEGEYEAIIKRMVDVFLFYIVFMKILRFFYFFLYFLIFFFLFI